MKKLMVVVLAILGLVGCQNSDIYSDDVYTADRAKQMQYVSYGTVTAIRPIKIQTNAKSNGSSSNALGSVGGAVIGGLLGNTVGGGKGQAIATGVGAVAGVVAGSKIGDAMSSVKGVELEIRQEDGRTIAVVQKTPLNKFKIGQAVKIISNGKNINVAPR